MNDPSNQVPAVASHALFSVDPTRDWPWGAGDNDNYMNECLCCKHPYRGHKRSIICCKCEREANSRWAAMTAEERLEHMRKAEADYAKFFAVNV